MKLKSPLITYTIVSIISSFIAYFMFDLGGSAAEVTGNSENLLGIGFKASGLLGGFIIIFVLSQRMILKFSNLDVDIVDAVNYKIHVTAIPEEFNKALDYICSYSLFDEVNGEIINNECEQRWEAGYLTIDIPNVKNDCLISIKVFNELSGQTWECDYFHPRAPRRELELIQN